MKVIFCFDVQKAILNEVFSNVGISSGSLFAMCLSGRGAVAYFRNQNDPLLACNMTRLKVDMRTSEEECRVSQNNFFRQTTWRSVVQCLQLQK